MARDEKSGSSRDGLLRAFDEVRFGAARTLNLRAEQPTALQARARAEQWLRQAQVEGAGEVLVITGRGNRSVDGYSPVREAIVQLLPSLRRRNVISAFEEHSPGSFQVTLAPVRALFEAPRRRRERGSGPPQHDPADLRALDVETRKMLRDLASMALALLGVQAPTAAMVDEEMRKHFAKLSAALPPSGDKEALLQQAIQRAVEELEADR